MNALEFGARARRNFVEGRNWQHIGTSAGASYLMALWQGAHVIIPKGFALMMGKVCVGCSQPYRVEKCNLKCTESYVSHI